MGFLWDVHGCSLEFLWGFRGMPMGFPLDFYQISMGSLWYVYDFSMGVLCDFCGVSMKFLLDFYDIIWGCQCKSDDHCMSSCFRGQVAVAADMFRHNAPL